MNNLAPITLFVYNRPDHTQQTVEALQKNELAEQSDLIIFSDGPKLGQEDKVKQVRDYIKTIKGFKSISIRESDINKGLANSIIDGVTEIVNKYGKVIVLEDDLVTSPYFLKYMNDALELYENEEKVISIHGYIYPVKDELPETFFIKGADCWGWATWRRGWSLFEADGQTLLKELELKRLTNEFDFNGSFAYTQMLKDQISGKNNSWAIRWYASAFLNNMYTLYPAKSLVAHIGFDQGTHCTGGKNVIAISNKPINLNKISPIVENARNKLIIEKYFRSKSKSLPNYYFIKKILKNIKNKLLKMQKKQETILFSGNYSSWKEAKSNCSGYDSKLILEKCKNALLKVKNGTAVYERDSVLFDHIEYSWPLLTGLMYVAAVNGGVLNVLDFGGSLGSSFFQNRKFFEGLKKIRWNIVEQKNFVICGKENFENEQLRFYYSLEECQKENKVNIIIVSSVLQYLEQPYSVLKNIIDLNVQYILFDRTAFIEGDQDRLTVQNVPPSIYSASYPAWFFNEAKFLEFMLAKYMLIEKFDTFESWEVDGIKAQDKGFIFKLKKI